MNRALALCLALTASLVAQSTRIERTVQPSGKGPQRLEVDLHLLGGSREDLGDLRLRTAGGQEVPYVLIPPGPDQPRWHPGRILPLASTKETSGFELDLGGTVSASRLRLGGLAAPFLKRFRLEGSGDRQRWTLLVDEGTLFDLPGEGLRLLDVDFPTGEFRYLRLVWDDRSSARMALPRTASAGTDGQGRAAALLEALPFEARPSESGTSRFALRLPGPGIPLCALRLEVEGQGPLLREAKIIERGDSQRTLGRGVLRRAEREGLVATDFRIPMERPASVELDLKVDNGDNPPLRLKRVSAELPPQPWIYFESPDGAPLRASYGESKLAGPRYDLEALRDRLRDARTGAARWEAPQVQPAAGFPTGGRLDPGPGAVLAGTAFRHQRPVPEAAGLSALVLDAHVLAQSPSLVDVRLLDAQNRQVPYLLERRDDPLKTPLAVPAGTTGAGKSTYVFALPQRSLPASLLRLETEARVFHRALRVSERSPEGAQRMLATTVWQHGDPDSPAPALVLNLPLVNGRELTLEIEEGDNPPLPIARATWMLPTWRLRFFHPGGRLRLCYGAELPEPRYDLALLSSRLRAETAQELTLGEEGAASEADRSPLLAKGFWAVLVLAVAALGWMLIRLLKQPNES